MWELRLPTVVAAFYVYTGQYVLAKATYLLCEKPQVLNNICSNSSISIRILSGSYFKVKMETEL